MSDIVTQNSENKTFVCKNCKHKMDIFQPEEYVIIACPNCNKIYHRNSPEVYYNLSNNWKRDYTSFYLYKKGKINDREITLIGKAYRKDNYEKWVEYVFIDQFNKHHFISECNGHYHYLEYIQEDDIRYNELSEAYKKANKTFSFNNVIYDRLFVYNVSTVAIVGEFNYNAVDTSKIKCVDFINPPLLLSIEVQNKHCDFFLGRYLSKTELKTIFPSTPFIESEYGTIGMAQPFFGGLDKDLVNKYAVLSAIVFSILFLCLNFFNSDYLVAGIHQANTTDGKEIVSRSFELKEKGSSYYLSFLGNSNIDNQWIENQLTLVNEKTGEEREIALGIEYYSGVDQGYSWSEGSNETEVGMSDVPSGKYHLKSKIISSNPDLHLPFNLEVYSASPGVWNYWILIGILAGLIILYNFAYNRFEAKRYGLDE